jgi:hypothetical protein
MGVDTMFGKVIYFDDKKFNDYLAIATGNKVAAVDSMKISNDKGLGVDIPFVSADVKGSKSYEASIKESILFDIANFESKLQERDDFFDFTLYDSEFDFLTINRGSIIKFDSFISVPYQFDLTQMIGQYKPMLTHEITSSMEKSESEAFNIFFNVCNPKIPLVSQLNEMDLVSLIESDKLLVQYPELEEYETMEVTILARIMASSNINKNKPIFDPLKDFISLNRATRREFESDRPDGMKLIFSGTDYRKIEIIAIYQ